MQIKLLGRALAGDIHHDEARGGCSLRLHATSPARAYLVARGLVALLSLFLCDAEDAIAESLHVNPHCGEPASSATITGEGWAASAEACEWRYYFEKPTPTPVEPPTPTPLQAPSQWQQLGDFEHNTLDPYRQFNVPDVVSGTKRVRTELWTVSEPKFMRQCREVEYRVVEERETDPWRNAPGAGQLGYDKSSGTKMTFKFDPEGICEIEECDQIATVQAIKERGIFRDPETGEFAERPLTWTDGTCGYWGNVGEESPCAHIYLHESCNGWKIDYAPTFQQPYAQEAPGGVYGKQGPSEAVAAEWEDAPTTYANGAVLTIFEFLDVVLCVKGKSAGTQLGSTTWTYRHAGDVDTIQYIPGTSTSLPTAEELESTQDWKDVKCALKKTQDANQWPELKPRPSPKTGRDCK